MSIKYRDAKTTDVNRCIEIRGLTRENPIATEVLKQFGVTEQSWKFEIEQERIIGIIAQNQSQAIGFCFGNTITGEIQSLAILPHFEGKGFSKIMLSLVVEKLSQLNFKRLWLAASPNREIRAHGFYRHLGWKSTGQKDNYGDEILELTIN